MRYFFKSRRFKIAAAIVSTLIIVSIIARIIGGIISPQSSVLGAVITPFQSAFTEVSNFFKDWSKLISGNEELARENASLKSQVNELISSLIDYDAAKKENDFLKQHLVI